MIYRIPAVFICACISCCFVKADLRRICAAFCCACLLSCGAAQDDGVPHAMLISADTVTFRSFVDCNMASVWIGDSFRIFPGKYGEDPLWGEAHELKYASGLSVGEVFRAAPAAFSEPRMPHNASPGSPGLHGAVWFETLYKDSTDPTGNRLYALYHNENYPSTLPYDPVSGHGYLDKEWPQGLKGAATKTAVCRIGIMQSSDGGRSWSDRGILLEDFQPRLILKPHNSAINFAGGTGDPSAVSYGGHLYVFYGEYGYPGMYDARSYDSVREWNGQCISVARIALSDLDHPEGRARRWDGRCFCAPPDSVGVPVASLRIPLAEGGGPASSPAAKYFWGPSVSWNDYLQCWVMLMAKAEGPSWRGNSIYISFNRHADPGMNNHSQDWSKPVLLLSRPGHILWYPSLQPVDNANDRAKKYTSLFCGKTARLFVKDQTDSSSEYSSSYLVEFTK